MKQRKTTKISKKDLPIKEKDNPMDRFNKAMGKIVSVPKEKLKKK